VAVVTGALKIIGSAAMEWKSVKKTKQVEAEVGPSKSNVVGEDSKEPREKPVVI